MLRTSDAITAAILGDNRRYSSRVVIDFASLRFDQSVAIRADNAIDGSIPDQITDDVSSYFRDRFFIGSPLPLRLFPTVENIHALGGYKPRRTLQKSHVGYIGSLAAADGTIDDLLGIRFSPRTVRGFKIVTDAARLIIDATFVLYASDRSVLAQREIQNNVEAVISFEFSTLEVGRPAAYAELSIHKATSNKRPWVVFFGPSLVRTFTDDTMIKWKVETKKTENKDATIGRVLIRSLNLTLFNAAREFDFYNSESELYGALQSGIPVTLSLLLNEESLLSSTFYVQTIEAAENDADVKIKATDLIGFRKELKIDAAIAENISAAAAFEYLAVTLGLNRGSIDELLRSVNFPAYSFSGTLGERLNDLAVITGSICSVSADGQSLVVARAASLRGRSRYPRRWFSSDEYEKNTAESQDKIPTVITVEYTTLEFEQSESVASSFVRRYIDMESLEYPLEQTVIPTYDRDPGAGLAPSWMFTFPKPTAYLRVEFSDSFAWESLEYEAVDNGDDTVTVKVWNFGNTSLDEQLTVSIMVRDTAKSILLLEEEQAVPARPVEYVAQIESDDVLERNSANTPYEFVVEMDDKIAITSIVPGNRQRPGQFEFVIEPTSYGCIVRVWNYYASEQTFGVSIYGRRLVESESTRTVRFRDEDGIHDRGEITKSLSITGIPSTALASDMARSAAAYYRTYQSKQSLIPWSDPRMEFGDHVAAESARGYGWVHGIIDEHSLESDGALSQAYKILEVKRHNRDSRVFGGNTLSDRPPVVFAKGDPV